jgi:hypothetical protein
MPMRLADLVRYLWGYALALLAWLASPQVLALIPPKWAAVVEALGVLAGLIGSHLHIAAAPQVALTEVLRSPVLDAPPPAPKPPPRNAA